jgi:sugar/nucleoside kinase (ribokinase family)
VIMSDKKIDILCIGNALVDVFAKVDGRFFARYGLTESVQHIEIDKLKEILSELPNYTAISGGGAANIAKIAALLGAKVFFMGAIGNDKFGRLFKKSLATAGVKLQLSKKPSPTGICLLLRNEGDGTNGETRIAASPSAALELSENDINREELRNARVVIIDGFILDKSTLVSHILQIADRNGTVLAIDLSSPGIARKNAAEIASYAKQYPLILFMNKEEAEAFREGLSSAMHETLFENNTQFPIIVVKLGQDGAVCYSEGKIIKAETQAVTPVDATGAGDAFCAGFLAAWVENKTPGECAAFGNMAAKTVLGAEGTNADKKALKAIKKLLKKKLQQNQTTVF